MLEFYDSVEATFEYDLFYLLFCVRSYIVYPTLLFIDVFLNLIPVAKLLAYSVLLKLVFFLEGEPFYIL